jgi:hypothetical protein
MYVGFNGTLAQWKDYLANADPKPAVLKGIDIRFDYDHRFSYVSPRVRFAFTPQLQAIKPDSRLELGFSFFDDRGKPVWDVSTVMVLANEHVHDGFGIKRFQAPTPDLDDDYQSGWERLEERRHPFDGVAADGNDQTAISAVFGTAAAQHPRLLYAANYYAEGTLPQAEMKAKLDLLMKDMQVSEH